MKTFRVFFEHGQAHDYEAASCLFEHPIVTFLDAEGNRLARIRDSDVTAVREITGEDDE